MLKKKKKKKEEKEEIKGKIGNIISSFKNVYTIK